MNNLLEKLVEEDYGLEINGQNWARSAEHDSLVINREKQLFYWNSRDIRGDAYIYLTKVRGLPHEEAKEILRNSNFAGTFIHELKDGKETVVYPKLVEVFHDNLLKEDRTYFYNRTITDASINRFQLGYHNGFYIIPIFQDGLFKQFQMRRDSPKLIRNYYKGVGPLVFNSGILAIADEVFFTESPISAIVLQQNGLPCISTNNGASGFMPEWIRYFIHTKKINILFDNDKAGEYGAIRVAKILGETRCILYNFWEFESSGFAADDYFIEGGTKDGLLELIKANGQYAFELEKRKKDFNRFS